MYDINAESQASTARTEEDSTDVDKNDTGRKGGTGATSPNLGHISQRVSGAASPESGSGSSSSTNGKILTQLISDAQDRLEEAEACLEWYENVKRRELKRLEKLRQLQLEEKQEQQQQSNQSPSE